MTLVKLAHRLATRAIGFSLVFAALAATAHATPAHTPEIDPGSLASALTLLASGVFVLSRKARKA